MAYLGFRFGQSEYREQHLNPNGNQVARHIIPVDHLEHYGANIGRYQQAMSDTNGSANYRMGSDATNSRDIRIDNQIKRQVFGLSGGSFSSTAQYNPYVLRDNGISHNQQLQAIGARFDHARDMHARTGDNAYMQMQRDLRGIAREHWNIDGRQWRTSGN